ncbi:MAG: hypothetical protein IPP89_11380 [Saprospiraceae bacterium]|nr:hypothetical protein [Candidatus Brachybacter algidus]MBL0119558.1 hypothetical protein [Candidatus Brachybacter algidus]
MDVVRLQIHLDNSWILRSDEAAEIILCNQELPATVTLNAIPATGGY